MCILGHHLFDHRHFRSLFTIPVSVEGHLSLGRHEGADEEVHQARRCCDNHSKRGRSSSHTTNQKSSHHKTISRRDNIGRNNPFHDSEIGARRASWCKEACHRYDRCCGNHCNNKNHTLHMHQWAVTFLPCFCPSSKGRNCISIKRCSDLREVCRRRSEEQSLRPL